MIHSLTHYKAPLLEIFPEDIILSDRERLIVASAETNCECIDLGMEFGLAVDAHGGPCTRHGMAIDYAAFLKASMPFFRKLTAIGDDRRFAKLAAESAMIPDSKYWIKIALHSNTQSGEFGAYMRSTVEKLGGLKVLIYRGKPLLKDADTLSSVLENWFATAVSDGYLGERLAIQDFRIEQVITELPPFGVVEGVSLSIHTYESGVTWPWIYLFLNLRRAFPRRKRFSIQFDSIEK